MTAMSPRDAVCEGLVTATSPRDAWGEVGP